MKKVLLFLMLCIAIPSIAQTELTDENAESKLLIDNDRLIVLDFYATWCGPCKRMDPILKELNAKYKDRVDFYKIDVDKSKVDDALGISAMPTYLFIYNSSNLEQIEGAMSKTKMEDLVKKHMSGAVEETVIESTETESDSADFDVNDFSQANLDKLWNSSTQLNSLAWNAYKNYSDIKILLKAIKAAERSIELEATYYNVDTHAALLYKTGNYAKALKTAKKAIDIAKEQGLSYASTTTLIEKIIDEM
ncbi:MAG: thioredoxin family protein [Kordia sp.]|uniref:thioredoxin family protein n=1 Tax=Kordia sp. TaxID=1965332 RepID=UPI00385D49A5